MICSSSNQICSFRGPLLAASASFASWSMPKTWLDLEKSDLDFPAATHKSMATWGALRTKPASSSALCCASRSRSRFDLTRSFSSRTAFDLRCAGRRLAFLLGELPSAWTLPAADPRCPPFPPPPTNTSSRRRSSSRLNSGCARRRDVQFVDAPRCPLLPPRPGSRQCVQTIRKHGPKLLDLRHRWILLAQRDASLLFHVLVGVNIAETLRRLCRRAAGNSFRRVLDGFDAFDVVESTLDDALLDDVFELLGDLRAITGAGAMTCSNSRSVSKALFIGRSFAPAPRP